MRTITPEIRRHRVPALGVGEGPLWHEGEQALYFVDIVAPALFRLDPKTDALHHWDMPSAIGSFGLCADGRAIVALRQGVHYFDFATNSLSLIANPEAGLDSNRLNDGKVGPDGRFWVGSMHDRPERHPKGSLYRIDPDGACTHMLGDLTISNGLAWSPDGRTLYHADTPAGLIRCFDYNLDDGSIGPARVLRTMDRAEGLPDGAAMDCEGFYWSAGVSAGCLNRIAPDGHIDLRVELPVPAPTMPCFGGPDRKTLFVTSLTASEPGTLISFAVDVAGQKVGVFGG